MKILRNPHFWIILLLFAVFSLLQYVEFLHLPGAAFPSLHWSLTGHSFNRILFLITIIYADWVFGFAAGLITTLAVALAASTHLQFPLTTEAILGTVTIVAVGIAICFFDIVKKQRKSTG